LRELTPAHVVVAEVSCFQLWTSPGFHPQVAVLTNLAPDHLDYHGSFKAYCAAKEMVMANLGPGETAVLNIDDPILSGWTAPNGASTWHYSRHGAVPTGVFSKDGSLWFSANDAAQELTTLSALKIPGDHNVENAMAAAGAALAFGVDVDAVVTGLQTYEGLEHRIEYVRKVGGVAWYNDSKATNPHAAEAALKAFDSPPVLLCGGSEKGSDFTEWATLVAKRCRHVVCFGQTGPRMAELLENRVPMTQTDTLREAITTAQTLANGSGVVVLSPACASFDQFQSYEDRGRQFKDMVHSLSS
jgi:UDP-N-acetylmuramoylalanine--D-glutamate ligase